MTADEAISLANQFVAENDLLATELIAIRFLKAEKFNELYGYDHYKSAFWLVEYRKRLPPWCSG
jgi:hypothetical protein